ncbi:pyridoxal phosphate-dependent aminotransferase [Pseudotabrizicola algicola]|uniref:Aminotransferase n=1 Tax=Pseudotabrizicola algicola TaxID=2709381 RepID=A0A6B3RKQ4_9RHOB|nr:pyridoxal phosphate-dependent aminotransferase [Pseudotabrizicola algicola]NEX46620.1 pyridoxal phosphate-dependent aminotransferase [Pseudotabrizicola algicola]
MTEATSRLATRVKLKDAHLVTRMTDIAEGLPDVIKLGRGDPDLDTPAHIIKAGQEALANGATHYMHPLGMPALRRAIADNIAAYGGARYEPENIVVTPGGQHAMFVIALALLNPGDEIMVPCPGYNPYHQAAEMAGAETVHIRTSMETNFCVTAEMVRAHITPRSKILVLINPNNPTGTVTPPAEVARIAEVAKEHDLIVISDEIYSRLTYGNHTVQPVAALPGMFERTITLSGMSKAYAMTGWRIGYFAGPPDLIPALAEINHAFAISTASVSQHAALAALTGPQDCVEDMRAIYDERRRVLCAGLTELGIPYAEPQGAFYVYADVSKTGIGATLFCERLLREGQVLMYPGGIYGDYTDDFVRMSLTQPVARIREALTRMKAVVDTIRAETRAA